MEKTCKKCQTLKPLSSFRKHRHTCIDCEYIAARDWRLSNKDRVKLYAQDYNSKKLYGISSDQVQQMYDIQKGRCAVCQNEKPLRGSNPGETLHIDHDHLTGEVRGLLCTSCNNGLGRFKDNPELLRRAAAYLEGGS